MAMIEKIRNQRWLLIVVVGVSLLGFLVNGAVLKWIQGGSSDIGEINGESISVQEWMEAVDRQKELFNYNGNENGLSNDTWNNLVEAKLLADQFDALGLTVTEEEYDEVTFGDMISAYVRQTIYQNQADTANINRMRQQFDAMPVTMANGYKNLISMKRAKEKYDLMIKKGMYANNLDGKWSFKQANDKTSIKYVVKAYTEIPDSTITVEESDIKAYYNKHKNDRDFRQETSRSIEYIKFPVQASASDSLTLQNQLMELAGPFRTASNDSAYAAENANTTAKSFFKYHSGTFPEPYNTQVSSDSLGKIIGPFVYNNAYCIAKVNKRMNALDSVQARHILVKADKNNATELATARAKADSLKSVIAKNNNFAEMAAQFGTDGTKNSGGDLGWFGRGAMVKEFETACFGGKMNELQIVVTDFGVHVVEVTGQKMAVAQVALVDRRIEPSSSTRKGAYNLASNFSMTFADTASFRAAADTLNGGTAIIPAKNIRPNSTTVAGLTNGGSLVSWAYAAELNEVSQPMMIDNDYVIAVLTEVKERGVPTLENVRERCKAEAIKEKKAEKFMALMQNGTLEDIAKAIESNVKVADNLTLKATNIPGSGVSAQEYEVIGIAFGLAKDKISSPIQGKGGVYVIQKTSDIVEGTSEDAAYTADRETFVNGISNRSAMAIFNSMKEEAEIEDNRYERR
jgi:peptidyl-prolyl cis-trans isomerase D